MQTSIRYSEEIQRIFKSFAGNYRQLWLGGIPTQEALSLVAEDWQEALAKFDAEEIEQGRKNWIYNNRMPPTIFEFKELLLRLKERLKTINSVPYPHDYNDDINGGVMTKNCIYWRKVYALPGSKIESIEQWRQLMGEAEKEEAEYIASLKAQQPKQEQKEQALFDETERGPEATARTLAKLQQMATEHLKKGQSILRPFLSPW